MYRDFKALAERDCNGERVYCGPAAIHYLTGEPMDKIIAAAKAAGAVRKRTTSAVRRRGTVVGMNLYAMKDTLTALGYTCDLRYPSDGLKERPAWRFHDRSILGTRTHWLACDGLMLADQNQVALSANHWARKLRVMRQITNIRKKED